MYFYPFEITLILAIFCIIMFFWTWAVEDNQVDGKTVAYIAIYLIMSALTLLGITFGLWM